MNIKPYAIAQAGEEAREVFESLPRVGENNNRRVDEAIEAAMWIENNPNLIAAAPELLDALERLFEHTAMVHNRWGEHSNTEEADLAIRDARKAIAKARGEG